MNPAMQRATESSVATFSSQDLATRFAAVRSATMKLAAPLSPEDCTAQSMPDCSPVKWHLAHSSWFFETFVLERAAANYQPFHPDFRVLFNSYYQSVGAQYARPQRGLITRPGLDAVLAYRRAVDERMQALLQRELPAETRDVIEIGLQHEQQHQELILTDLKHLLSFNPLYPVYQTAAAVAQTEIAQPLRWRTYDEGLFELGHDGGGFAFDNEGPRHRVFLAAYQLASRAVTNREYLEFMTAGGYERPELWLSDGWNEAQAQGWRAPLYWLQQDAQWFVFTLGGLQPVRLDEPVCHLSYYEADAFAHWAGARLPTEAEWEHAAADAAIAGNFVESGALHPTAVGDASQPPAQMFGDVWEWTGSAYLPYPGFRAPSGALGEYNGKFMCNQFVLRGGSCATPQSHIRASYRNFFPPSARWQFSGLRLARDLA